MLEHTTGQSGTEALQARANPTSKGVELEETEAAVNTEGTIDSEASEEVVKRALASYADGKSSRAAERAAEAEIKRSLFAVTDLKYARWNNLPLVYLLGFGAFSIYQNLEIYHEDIRDAQMRARNQGYTLSPSVSRHYNAEMRRHDYQLTFLWTTCFCAVKLTYARRARKRKLALQTLAKSMDRRSPGPMIDAVRFDSATRKAATEGLIEFLPQMRASDELYLNIERRKSLNIVLMRKGDDPAAVKLKCAILAAYEQVGDASALPIVNDLAYGEGNTSPDVREAAIACLPALKARLDPSQGSDELLRGSAAETASAETLVRPAASGAAMDTHELLRVTSQSGND